MSQVKVNPKESVDAALARFKQKCRRDKIRDEVRKRRFYEKPSAKRRQLALKAQRKSQRRNRLYPP